MLSVVETFIVCLGFFGPADPGIVLNFKSESARQGFTLFNHQWQPNDALSKQGDGLGPVFNAVSCAACHPGGGASGNDHNVQLLTEKDDAGAKTIVLHRRGTAPSYPDWRLVQLGLKGDLDSEIRNARIERYRLRKYNARPPVFKIPTDHTKVVHLSERNTPALFGASLIDSISLTDLQKIESLQESLDDGISGRVPMVDGNRPGRFGWRGQLSTLKDFVLGACANELGLQFEGHQQPADPLNPRYWLEGADLSFQQAQQLIDFVASLDAPGLSEPQDDRQQARRQRGKVMLQVLHCDRCHREQVGNVTGIFSDLLLHDMGQELADPVPAAPQMVVTGVTQSGGGYFGSFSTEILQQAQTNVHQEWRTPPLWGVADTAPYLHDGRAATLTDAIRMHGGEAAPSRDMFLSSAKADQLALLAFLGSLSTKDAVMAP